MIVLGDEMLEGLNIEISSSQTERQGRQESELCFILRCAPVLASKAVVSVAGTEHWTSSGSSRRRCGRHCSNLQWRFTSPAQRREGGRRGDRETETESARVLIGFGSCERLYL